MMFEYSDIFALIKSQVIESPTNSVIDEGALGQLMDMGFSMNGSKRALTAVGGSNVEAAMEWVFPQKVDPDFNDPLPEGNISGSSAGTSSNNSVSMKTVKMLSCHLLRTWVVLQLIKYERQ